MLIQTFSIISRNWLYCILAITALTALDFLDSLEEATMGLVASGLGFLILVLISYQVQNTVLFNVKFGNSLASKSRFRETLFPYFLKYFVIYIIIGLAAIPIVFLGLAFSTPWLESSSHEYLNELSIATFVLTILIAFVWSSIGTWLPATIYGRRTTFNDATQRNGRGSFVLTLCRLFLAFAVFSVASFLLQKSQNFLFWIHDDRPAFVGATLVLGAFIANMMYIFVMSYVAVVLANIYKKEEVAE